MKQRGAEAAAVMNVERAALMKRATGMKLRLDPVAERKLERPAAGEELRLSWMAGRLLSLRRLED